MQLCFAADENSVWCHLLRGCQGACHSAESCSAVWRCQPHERNGIRLRHLQWAIVDRFQPQGGARATLLMPGLPGCAVQLAHDYDASLLASNFSAEGAQTIFTDRLDCSDQQCEICNGRLMQSVPGWWRVARPFGRSPAISAASKGEDRLLNLPTALRAATSADYQLQRPLCTGHYRIRAQQYASDATA